MSDERRQGGFEHEERFYPWRVSDTIGSDLLLIDRFTGMTPREFFGALRDDEDSKRSPVLFALLATSLRHGNPSWSVERIARIVERIDLNDIEFIEGDDASPPAGAADQAATETSENSGTSATEPNPSPEPTSEP